MADRHGRGTAARYSARTEVHQWSAIDANPVVVAQVDRHVDGATEESAGRASARTGGCGHSGKRPEIEPAEAITERPQPSTQSARSHRSETRQRASARAEIRHRVLVQKVSLRNALPRLAERSRKENGRLETVVGRWCRRRVRVCVGATLIPSARIRIV